MVSANPTGPITVASGRNGAYGDSVARLIEFAGDEVEREYYYNDSGAQMERFKTSVEARQRGEEPPEDGYRGSYIDELAASGEDPVQRMLAQIERTLDRFRVHFDSWVLQSQLEGRLDQFLPRLDTYEKDGAVWARSSEYGDDADRVLIRSPEQGGGPTYRAADVVFLDEFIDEVGVDAARWYLVSRGPDRTIEIDVDLAAERSQKNPVYYVQYAHARIAGVLRNAGDTPVGGDVP